MSKALVPEAKNGLSAFKNEVANELGVPFTDYNGNLTSRQCGSVGGEMVKRMVEQYESGLKQSTTKEHTERDDKYLERVNTYGRFNTKRLLTFLSFE